MIYSIERIRLAMVQVSRSIAYDGNLGVYPQKACTLNIRMNSIERRMGVSEKVFSVAVEVERSRGVYCLLSRRGTLYAYAARGRWRAHTFVSVSGLSGGCFLVSSGPCEL